MQRLLLILCCLLLPAGGSAQNITSPYSILGIGDIESKDYGKFFGMASAAQAIRNASFINLNNPASLASLDPGMLNIDINSRWRSSSFQYKPGDSFTSSYNDAAIRRMSLTFKPGKVWGFSFGIKPYSTVNYLIDEKLSLFDGSNTQVSKTVTGSGGINEVYLANGVNLGAHFSAGLTVSYLWGSLSRSTLYYYEDIGVNIVRNEYEELRGVQFQAGMQYSGKTGEALRHNFGVTLRSPVSLKGRFSTEYLENDTTVSGSSTQNNSFDLPLQLAAGYALIISNVITVSADYTYSFWKKIKLDYPNAYTTPSSRFALGFQYAPLKNMQGQQLEKVFVQAGLAYEQSYLTISNNQIRDLSATAGLGANLSRLMNVYLGIEVGTKGDVSAGQIKERYTQVSAGITLKEFWRNTKKYRRYQ